VAGSVAVVAVYRARSRHRSRLQPVSRDRGRFVSWRFDDRFQVLPAGKTLRIELDSPATVHWTVNQWDIAHDTRTVEAEPGLHVADLDTTGLPSGTRVQFTFYWPAVNRWEGEDFEVKLDQAAQHAS
jgi:glucoamylase